MKQLLSLVNEDLKIYGGTSFSRKLLVFFFNVPFRLLLNYRLGHYLSKRRNPLYSLIILWIKKRQLTKYNCDISYNAIIGRRFSIPHPLGIVIGEGAVIKDDVMMWQNVTLGSHGKKQQEKSYPQINNGVKLYSGCQVIGGITIDEYSKIGAGSIVLIDVPKKSTAVGSPARII